MEVLKNKQLLEEKRLEFVLKEIKESFERFVLFGKTDEGDFFDISPFLKKYNNEYVDLSISIIRKEIETHTLYKTKLGFGNTAMFIYDEGDEPESCWG